MKLKKGQVYVKNRKDGTCLLKIRIKDQVQIPHTFIKTKDWEVRVLFYHPDYDFKDIEFLSEKYILANFKLEVIETFKNLKKDQANAN